MGSFKRSANNAFHGGILRKVAALLLVGGMLAGCQAGIDDIFPKEERPIPAKLMKKMDAKGMRASSPILLRIYKEENVMEVWKQTNTGRYAKLTEYEICKWSGKLGPKFKEGDRQAPEGFYHVTPAQMNPRSQYHLSFNMGFPNTYDRAHGRTGSHLMVHGACSSAGCYSMTDEYVEEIYALAREAFDGGQKAFQIQAFPFRMTAENMAKHVNHPQFAFWRMLKEGSDHFEITNRPPKVDVCESRYIFNRQLESEEDSFSSREECPPSWKPQSLAVAFTQKQSKDQEAFEKLLKTSFASPFVAEEDKPKSVEMSILAEPTTGPLAIRLPEVKKPETEEKTPQQGITPDAQETAPVVQDGSAPQAVQTAQNSGETQETPSGVSTENTEEPIRVERLPETVSVVPVPAVRP